MNKTRKGWKKEGDSYLFEKSHLWCLIEWEGAQKLWEIRRALKSDHGTVVQLSDGPRCFKGKRKGWSGAISWAEKWIKKYDIR